MVAWLDCLVTRLLRYLVAWHLTFRHLTPDTFNHKTPSSQAGTRARTPAVPPWFPPVWAGTRSGTAWGKAYARAPVTEGEIGAPTGGLRPVRFAAPEGFSACHRRPASTIPGSLWACHRPTRLHRRLWVMHLACLHYAIKARWGQLCAPRMTRLLVLQRAQQGGARRRRGSTARPSARCIPFGAVWQTPSPARQGAAWHSRGRQPSSQPLRRSTPSG